MDFLYTRIPFITKISVFIVVWLWETWRPMFLFQQSHRIRHAVRNISIALINVLLLGIFILLITNTVCNWALMQNLGLLNWIRLPGWLDVIVALLLIDAWMYIWHRMNHKISFLWRFHRMHHSDEALDVTSASRFHPGELLFSALLRTCLIPIFGLSIEQILIYEFVLMPVILFCHSNVAISEKWDRGLRWLIVSPRMHWVHHSELIKETNSNYSSIFSFWDRLAKTYIFRKDPEKIQYGLDDKKITACQSIPAMLKTPLI